MLPPNRPTRRTGRCTVGTDKGPATPHVGCGRRGVAQARASRDRLGLPVRPSFLGACDPSGRDSGSNSGKHKEVIQFLRKETARRPGDARLWAFLADVVADAHGTAAGLGVVDEAQAAAGDGPDVRLVRAKLYVAEPGRVRPLAPLAERIESWPEADQLRLLYGLVEVFDHVGDQANVIQMLRRIAGRRPADAVLWTRIHERATLTGDAKSAAEARAALVKLEGETANSVVLCDAATADAKDAAKSIELLTATFGSNPTRSDACLALARLFRLTGKAADAARLTERAFALEPTRYEAAKAWLTHLCGVGVDDRAQQLVTRLATDPRWAGDPFRRVIASVVPTVPTATAAKLLGWTRPHVERDPGGLGWVADIARTHKVFDPIPLLEEATRRPTATADDWLCLALARKPDDLNSARAKLTPAAYLAAVSLLLETAAGKEFDPSSPHRWRSACSRSRGSRSNCRAGSRKKRRRPSKNTSLRKTYRSPMSRGADGISPCSTRSAAHRKTDNGQWS